MVDLMFIGLIAVTPLWALFTACCIVVCFYCIDICRDFIRKWRKG